ncbi:MAG TPA: AbgT family transporter [Pyrinomonadaceae bacterium]|nr:AbgT family transporter [Pyrinomonadaceae bacterium]
MENIETKPEAGSHAKDSFLNRFLGFIERAGNLLPHPATLFVILAVFVVLLSALTAWMGVSVVHPGTKEVVRAESLLNVAGLNRILTSLVTNFTGFAPLGTVLVAMLGIAVAEGSGLISAVLRAVVLSAPRRLLTFVVVFAGVMSHMASDVGYVLVIPLGAMIFLAVGRHPLAGLAAAFAGVSGGFSANLLLGPTDPLLAGLTQEAARILDKAYVVTPAANYYFMATSAVLVALAGTWITEKVIVPRFGEYQGEEKPEELKELSAAERRGLWLALLVALLFVAVILWGLVPSGGFLRDPQTNGVLRSPFLTGIVAVIFFGGALVGLAYGIGAGTIRNDSDVMKSMEKAMSTMSLYLVLAFFAAQFVAFFNWTHLGVITAVKGAELLRASGIGGIPLIICFVIVTVLLDLVLGSASAKWAVMAPVFVPMFMLLGYSPELTQAAYRIGDSVANIITPLMSYFPLVVAFAQRYDKRAGIGTVMATMLPYSVTFFVFWTLLLIIWYLLGLPLGPGAGIYYHQAPTAP